MLTSGCGSDDGGGDKGSLSSGIGSCSVPFTALELGPASMGGSGLMPFGLSLFDWRVCLGEPDTSDARGVDEILLRGEAGRGEEDPVVSRSFDFPLPKPLKAELRLDDDFLSGDSARPYGCTLCLRLLNTVPNRFRGFELCFGSGAAQVNLY
jgi:hypothetical protein